MWAVPMELAEVDCVTQHYADRIRLCVHFPKNAIKQNTSIAKLQKESALRTEVEYMKLEIATMKHQLTK